MSNLKIYLSIFLLYGKFNISVEETVCNIFFFFLKFRIHRRIINDRIEKSIKGRQIGHTGERGRGLLCISIPW